MGKKLVIDAGIGGSWGMGMSSSSLRLESRGRGRCIGCVEMMGEMKAEEGARPCPELWLPGDN